MNLDVALSQVRNHPLLQGFAIDDLLPDEAGDLVVLPLRPGPELLGAGFQFDGGRAVRNSFVIKPRDQLYDKVKIEALPGAEGAILMLGRFTYRVNMRVILDGPGQVLTTGDCRGLGGTINLSGERNICAIGRETSINHANIRVHGAGRRAILGRDCMLSAAISIRTTDSHGIIDLKTGDHINPHEDIVIGNHVWLGQESMVLKGVTIGAGSIIGTRSVVTSDIPACALAIGTPARILRRGVSWVRPGDPTDEEIGYMRAVLGSDIDLGDA